MRFTLWLKAHWQILGTILLASVLAFYKAGTRTLWMDETAVLEYLRFTPSDFVWTYFSVPDNHPPLYYFLVNILFNATHWHSVVLVRSVSILAGIGLVYLTYRVGQLIFKNQTYALLSALVVGISPYGVLISQMARYHSLAALCTLGAYYYFVRICLSEGSARRNQYGLVIVSALTGWVDYPHFIYLVLLTNAYFVYRWLIVRRVIVSVKRWILLQSVVAVSFLPMLWLMYARIVVQGDGGFHKMNILGNGLTHFATAVLMHVYAFFFGENILPWNVSWWVGAAVLAACLGAILYAIARPRARYVLWPVLVCLCVIVLNTVFLTYADPRYNFVVYPKYGYVAFPLFVLALVSVLRLVPKIGQILFVLLWLGVELVGLSHFYARAYYLNPSYFNTSDAYTFVRDHAQTGDRLFINGDANIGVYDFFKTDYFQTLTPFTVAQQTSISSTLPKGQRMWYFTTASDEGNANNTTDSKIPTGFSIADRFDSVPLDPMLQKYKEKLTGYPSYTYKYTVFLLVKS